MEVLVNPDGTRNRDFRPIINEENILHEVSLYTPYYRVNTGLYDHPQCACPSFQSQFKTTQIGPNYGVDSFGNIIWYGRQYQNRYY